MPTTELQLFAPGGPTLFESSFAPDGITGPTKVAQRFLFYLLTPIGTVPGQPTVGTDFLSTVRTFRSEFDLFAAFSVSEPQAGVAVRACESTDDPLAERYGFARLSGIAVDGDQVTLTLTVVAADGSSPPDPVVFSIDT